MDHLDGQFSRNVCVCRLDLLLPTRLHVEWHSGFDCLFERGETIGWQESLYRYEVFVVVVFDCGPFFFIFSNRSPFSVFFCLDLFVFWGDDVVTAGKMTSFVSVKTMLFKLVGMIASIPSGLAIGPEGKRRKACIRVK